MPVYQIGVRAPLPASYSEITNTPQRLPSPCHGGEVASPHAFDVAERTPHGLHPELATQSFADTEVHILIYRYHFWNRERPPRPPNFFG
eukprot:SAG11_NODE_26700_length_342_cov_0.440329_1_plen_88_part_10